MKTALKPVKSSSIAAVGYDEAKQELHIKFHGGATHVYSGVTPEKHEELVGAESIGSHFHHNIRNEHKQRKLT